jgi:hypothetical protein
LLLPTQFLAPSFHLSGTDSCVSFVWHESHTIIHVENLFEMAIICYGTYLL